MYIEGSFSSALKEIQFHVLLQIMASAFSPFSFDIFATSEMPLLTGHAEQHTLLPQCRDTLKKSRGFVHLSYDFVQKKLAYLN